MFFDGKRQHNLRNTQFKSANQPIFSCNMAFEVIRCRLNKVNPFHGLIFNVYGAILVTCRLYLLNTSKPCSFVSHKL